MPDLLRALQGWIGLVGFMALGNTISCYRGHQFLADKLYTGAPTEVTALMGRVFGVWTFLSAVLRISCAYDLRNRTVYNLTLMSFLLAFVHFVSECYLYKTSPITIGVLAPLSISGVSILLMMLGYSYLDTKDPPESLDRYRSARDIPLSAQHKAKSR